MKGLLATLIFTLVLGVLPVTAARATETIRVQINTQKRAPKSRLTIRFLELIEDSRCPVDTNCVWAGNATIKVRVSRNGRNRDLTLETNGQNNSVKAHGYSIKFVALTPVPRSNIRINRNGYVATLAITR